ncbi:single-stranded DNA-binding protein [Kitasatospora azatica]|uniref:single-stranded DNA-binding protein n=1 Tax=Kitasatospora azatica TaxID=58347 RepID=UPI0007C7077D|nr:single-stranded DNA-binding protein [Kitasatospora azatica]
MNETMVTMIGNVASPVNYAQTAAGVPMANFRLAATERRYDRARGEWVDGETNWVTVVAWRWLATNVVSSLGKGDPVVVSGRLRVKEWEDEGKRRSSVEIDARVVGHDLGRGTSAFRWTVRGRPEPIGPQSTGLQSAGEAVPEWIAKAVREHRLAEAQRDTQSVLVGRELEGVAEAAGSAGIPEVAGVAGAVGAPGMVELAEAAAGAKQVRATAAPPDDAKRRTTRSTRTVRSARSTRSEVAVPAAEPMSRRVDGGELEEVVAGEVVTV